MKSKILFIMHMPPPVHGAAMVGKYIHDSRVVNDNFECEYINLATAKDLTDIGKVGIRKFIDFFKLLKRIRKTVKSFGPELVYITPNAKGGAFYKDYVIVQMLKRMRCKVIAHYHNKGVSTRSDKALDNFLYKRFFKDIKVILLAEALYKDVEKYVTRNDMFICPNGIPESLTEEPNVTRNNEIPHILFLSNLIESKGVFVLLDALKIIKDQGYSFVCDFVGGETAEINTERFNKEVEIRGLNELVIYHGRKYGEDKKAFFETADIFTFPTYYHNETFGLVNLEAMEYKLPVVTTNEGGIPDVVKDGKSGFIVDSSKRQIAPLQLAEKIINLLDDPSLRYKMGEEGYRLFKEHYTLDKFEENFSNVINNQVVMGGVMMCRYFGPCYGNRKQSFLSSSDIFVFPTTYHNECFPLVLLEAMQFGLPCITSNEGGIRDIVIDNQTGLIMEECTEEDLATKLKLLISNKDLREQMGNEGRKRFKQMFTLEVFETNLVGILKSQI